MLTLHRPWLRYERPSNFSHWRWVLARRSAVAASAHLLIPAHFQRHLLPGDTPNRPLFNTDPEISSKHAARGALWCPLTRSRWASRCSFLLARWPRTGGSICPVILQGSRAPCASLWRSSAYPLSPFTHTQSIHTCIYSKLQLLQPEFMSYSFQNLHQNFTWKNTLFLDQFVYTRYNNKTPQLTWAWRFQTFHSDVATDTEHQCTTRVRIQDSLSEKTM